LFVCLGLFFVFEVVVLGLWKCKRRITRMLSPRIHSPSRFKNNSTPGVAGQSRLAVSSRAAVTTGSGNHGGGGGGGGLVRAVVRVRPGLESDRDNKPFHIKVVKGVDGEDLFQISATKSRFVVFSRSAAGSD
jgi:hypothetical protein